VTVLLIKGGGATAAGLLQVRGVNELRVPGQPFQTHDSYCVCSYGDSTVRPRTRVVENSASPQWNEVRCVRQQAQIVQTVAQQQPAADSG
jgi:hypothetical protein